MIKYTVKDERDEHNKHIGFLTAEDTERELYLHCVIYICNNNTISIDGFLDGSVGKYQFQSTEYKAHSMLFRGRGRGRKPETAENSMKDFIKEVQRETNGKTVEEIKGLRTWKHT